MNRVAQSQSAPQTATAMVTVVAANREIPVRSVLTAADLQEIELPADTAPASAIRSVDEAVGKLTMATLYAGEPLLDQRLVKPNVVSKDGRKAMFLMTDQVLMAIPASDLMSRSGVMQPGDKADVFYSLPFPENRGVGTAADAAKNDQQATFTLLQNVEIVALTGALDAPLPDKDGETKQQQVTQPSSILLSLPPQDALTLKYMIDAGGTIDLVLRAPGVERPFTTDPVDVDYLVNRYRIPTGPGR